MLRRFAKQAMLRLAIRIGLWQEQSKPKWNQVQMRNLVIVAIVMLSCAGCYHLGNPSGRIALNDIHIVNKTREPDLQRMLNMSLREQVVSSPGIRFGMKEGQSGLDLDIELVSIRNVSIARAEVRDKYSRDNDDEAYQSVLNRIELTAVLRGYTAGIQPRPETPAIELRLIGQGDIPQMHDRDVPLQAALKQAAHDIASQIVAAVAESKP